MRILFSIVLISVALSLASAQLSGYSTPETIKKVSSKASAILASPSSLPDAYHAASLLQGLKPLKASCKCDKISSLLNGERNGLNIFYGIEASNICGCPAYKASSKTKESLFSDSKSEELTTFAGALLALKSLKENVPEDADVVSKLTALMQPNGKFKSSLHAAVSTATISNAKIALKLLEAFSSSKATNSDISDAALHLLPAGDDESASDPTVLASIMKISAEKPRLSASRLTVITEALLALVHSNQIATAATSLASLESVLTYKIAPIFVFIENPVSKISSVDALKVQVVDALGKAVTVEKVVAKSLKLNGGKELLPSGVTLNGGSLELSSLNLAAGRYSVDFGVTIKNRSNTVTITKYFAVVGSLDIVEVFAGVTDSKQSSTSDLSSFAQQNKMSDLRASALATDVFHVAFSLTSSSKPVIKPHQVFVRLVHSASGTSTYLPGKALRQGDSNSKLVYRTVLIPSEEIETFLHLSGEYLVSILVGDASMEAPIEWVIGSLDLHFPAKVVQDSPLYTKALLHAADNTLIPLPEIVHQMRAPDKRASLATSSSFTILVAVPLLGLLAFILTLKPNLDRLSSLVSFLFVISLGLVLALYLGYWFTIPGCSFYQTLKYLCFLLPVTVVLGSNALVSVTEARKREVKK